jgi:hypothetical protein
LRRNDYAAYYEIAHSALALAGNEHRKDCLAAFSLLGIHEKTRPAEIEPQRAEAGAGRANPEPKEMGAKTGPPQPLRRPTLPTFLPSQTHEFATAATITDWVFASCDGCDKDLNIPDDSYVCTMCIDMNFCSDCQPKLKNNTLGFRICSPNHELLYIPKAPGPLPKDMVRYDDEYVPILEWLSKLKKIWGV